MSFNNLRQKLNNSVIQKLSDAVVSVKGNSFNGIFTREYIETHGFTGYKPILKCLAEDSKMICLDDKILIDNVEYIARERQPDGYGWIIFMLELNDGS